MRKTAVGTLFAAALMAFAVLPSGNNMKQFQWLEGNWSMKTKRGMIMESWKANHDSSLLGSSKMVAASGEEKILESLELIYSAGHYYYVSAVNGQNNNQPVRFRLSSHDGKGFVAENPEHDFPKRIIYELVNKDSIHAYIDGGPSAPGKRSDFYYVKSKN